MSDSWKGIVNLDYSLSAVKNEQITVFGFKFWAHYSLNLSNLVKWWMYLASNAKIFGVFWNILFIYFGEFSEAHFALM